ncbi:Putative ornithine cyclodeaminase/mu-crystallin, NAD(P)-binding domain superfamily [Septoria linicola]|uniref:Ornithine cyclodeaminase/mu-crystallin, NAD(P)-binding domain superfamily n=1 Tax=Septoria linicola TaxID=215465 RepID=A0A9Q9AN17_9PEZI|nr:Putative ornithine cyclodeaminase/mu-crystallin, NAD(P)-binding domain superfamily [Septoria linicola]
MPLQILSDRDVSKILHSFNREDILELQATLADALHWYSTSSDGSDCCSDYQPERSTLKRKDGSTTLYLPASGITGQGVKVVNIVPPDTNGLPPLSEASSDGDSRSSISSTDRQGSFASTQSARSNTSSIPTSVSNVTDSTGNLSLTSKSDSGQTATSTIKGSLTLLDNVGNTVGLINAEEVTAFRTALASTLLLKKRHSVHDVTIFGAGKQAYWHARLALILRGDEIHHLNIVTRNFESARRCVMRLYNPQPDDPDYVNHVGEKYNARTKKTILTPAHTEYERLLKEYVRASNVIFCTTPSTTPLFPASYLTNPEGRKKGRYIACIGSLNSSMIELAPDVLRYAVAPHHEHKHIHKRQKEGGAILVDTVTGCLKHAGEVVQAKLLPDQVVELGELFMLKRDAEQRASERGEKVDVNKEGCQLQENSGLKEWLTKGNVIYKSVGLGLMDIVVGNELLRVSREQGVGVTMDHF